MKILPLAAESLGVRSSAVFVETADVKILIDPGVSLAPARYGLPPHTHEIKKMNESWRRIKEYAHSADILIITHYHFDHFDPTEPLVFNNKVLLLKHPKENINSSQRERARDLMRSYRTLPRRVEFVDGNCFEFGDTSIRFSQAVPHGPGTKVGWVVQASIKEGDRGFLHTSDVQGACLPEHAGFILSESPDTLFMDGPLTYLMGQAFTGEDLRASVRNISELLEKTRVQTIIIDHHGLRDQSWRERIREVFAKAETLGKRVVSVAEFTGAEEELLEARRRQLFAWYPDLPEEPILRNGNFHLVKELKK